MAGEKVHALEVGLPVPNIADLSDETRKYWDLCSEKLGMVPNMIKAYGWAPAKTLLFRIIIFYFSIGYMI